MGAYIPLHVALHYDYDYLLHADTSSMVMVMVVDDVHVDNSISTDYE